MNRPSWIGQTLGGRYRIDDILGQGGMSAVYKAYDPNLKRVVAIKMIHAHLADDQKFVVRFEEEAAAVAQLRHPNIVQVFDFNHDGDQYYMVQEFVAGETLQERLRFLNKSNRRMPLSETIGYIINICSATGYAHARGLVHRDIKPANIMLDIHKQAILMDFGIVKITGGEKHTATGAVIGTAQYLPPELIRGETPDPRSDQYSLAVTLFEAVSGRPPFEADSAMRLMMMHLNDSPPDLHQLRPDVPPSLVAVIEKALSKNREDRFASMAEFASALQGVLVSLRSAVPAATVADQSVQLASQPVVEPYTPPARTDGFHPTVQNAPAGMASASAPTPGSPSAVPLGATPAKPISSSVSQSGPLASQSLLAAMPQTGQTPPAASQSAAPARSLLKPALIGGVIGFAGLVLIAIVVILLGAGIFDTPPAAPPATTAPAATQAATQAALAVAPTTEPSATLTPTFTPTMTPPPPPTAIPTITPSPTPTIPVGVPYSRINAITINEQGYYVVEYETFEFTESTSNIHVHFFFNTVPQEQAGLPGSGPWILYGGPHPFEQYHTSDRPASATQMCILVANPDHSVQFNTGNCFILPDVNAAVSVFNDPCLAGPGPEYPVLSQLSAGQVLLVTGISADEAWWTVDNPSNPGQSCWLHRSRSDFSGDMTTLPLAEIPPTPEGGPSGMTIQITQITLDAQGHYVVEFTTSGFTPAIPGTHIHFFFDIYAADQLGSAPGNRLMYAGASPFTGYSQADRPAGATQLCALVANPDHSVIVNSGNCFALP